MALMIIRGQYPSVSITDWYRQHNMLKYSMVVFHMQAELFVTMQVLFLAVSIPQKYTLTAFNLVPDQEHG